MENQMVMTDDVTWPRKVKLVTTDGHNMQHKRTVG